MASTAWIPAPPPEPDLSTWWRRLDYVREEIARQRGEAFSVVQMAKEMGYPHATFSTWLKGTARPSDILEVIARAVELYEVDRDWLTWGGPLVTPRYPRQRVAA